MTIGEENLIENFDAVGRIRGKLSRVMRGQVVVREHEAQSGSIWTPLLNQREVRYHRGTVLVMGLPAQATFLVGGRVVKVEQPFEFAVGDTVLYHFARHNRIAWTFEWEDGLPATWVPQSEIDAVIET